MSHGPISEIAIVSSVASTFLMLCLGDTDWLVGFLAVSAAIMRSPASSASSAATSGKYRQLMIKNCSGEKWRSI